MRCVTLLSASVVAATVLFHGAPADAQTQDAQSLRQEIDQLRKDFEARLAALETRLAAIQGGQPPPAPAQAGAPPTPPTAPVPPGAQGAGGPTGALPVYGSAISGSKIFNPDMAVIGD